MYKHLVMMLGMGAMLFASFPASSHYDLNSYSVGPGGSSNSSSTTYHLQGTVGGQTNGSAASTHDTANSGSVNTEQLSVPQAPTVSNGSGTYYNKLLITLNNNAGTSSYPTDVTFAIAESTTSCSGSLSYMQADGSLNSTPVYQTYSAWLGSSGTFMVGLASGSTYFVKVAAKQGQFTNTEYGACNSAATVAQSISFSVSPNTLSMGNILPGAVTTSSNVTLNFATDAASGGDVYVYGLNSPSGLHSAKEGHTILATSSNLSGASEGFGVQATGPTQTSGGPLAADSPFNGTSHNVGAETTSPLEFLSTAGEIVGGTASANVQAISANITPGSTDYTETLTFLAAGSF